MKSRISTLSLTLVASAISAILTACGGGGGTAPATQPTSPPVATAPQPGNLVMTMPSSTYAADSSSTLAFTEINQARLAGGYGAITQDTNLDKAATSHASYFFTKFVTVDIPATDDNFNILRDSAGNIIYKKISNGQEITVDPATGILRAHVETVGDVGFTGVKASDRATAAGYGWSAQGVGEVIGSNGYNSLTGCVNGLLNSVYHRDVLLDPRIAEVGIGIILQPTAVQARCVINVALGRVQRVTPDNWVGVYPGASSVGVAVKMPGEAPNPAPEYAVIGQPISIFIAPGHTISVSKFTLAPAGGSALPGKILTKLTDPNTADIQSSHAAFVPNGALQAATVYTVAFEGTDKAANGTTVAVSKTWSFTTK